VRDGLIPEGSFWGTINCNGINARGDICGVTTTSGLSWKIPGRAGDSPILGAGLYVDNEVGAAGSTGRGEANLYNLSSYLIVENMRRGMAPKDAGMEALRRIKTNTVDPPAAQLAWRAELQHPVLHPEQAGGARRRGDVRGGGDAIRAVYGEGSGGAGAGAVAAGRADGVAGGRAKRP
jgi:hypothetical protein